MPISELLESSKKINEIYDGMTYFDQYGSDVVIFFILIVILFIVWSYSKIIVNIQPIKDDWVNQRCKASIIPFAGIINPPEGSTATEFAQENFTYCTQNILISITGYIIAPLTYLLNTLNMFFEELRQIFQYLRELIDSIRKKFAEISEEVMGRTSNVTFSFFPIIIKLKNAFEQSRAILISGIYTTLGGYYTLKSLLGAILQIIVIILIAMAILIVICWLTLQFWIAIPGTITFGIIAAFMIVIIVFCVDVLNISVPGMPGPPKKPSCFDEDTLLKLKDGVYKKIKDIKVGDTLAQDGEVTAKMELDATEIDMYYLSGIVVSGTHCVKMDDNWMYVRDHSDAIKIYKYPKPIIYCLNTKSKEINIQVNNINKVVTEVITEVVTFNDWDEIYEKELKKLSEKTGIDCLLTKNIHKEFDIGVSGNTIIQMIDQDILIKDVRPGMILKNGIKVYGIVEINGKDLKQNEYNLGCINILGTINLQISTNDYLDKINNDIIQEDKLYNLLTDNGKFFINNTLFNDYNSAVELFLDIV